VTVVVRWIPLVPAAYGTRVARPVRTTAPRTWQRWDQLTRWVRPSRTTSGPLASRLGGAAGDAEFRACGLACQGGLAFGWSVAVTAGRAAPAARRWQTGLGSALSGGPVPARRARSATGAAAGRLAHQPGSQPAGSRAPGGVPLEGRSHRDRQAPTVSWGCWA
jgi:hypothetical protein